ncbi:NHL repeat-containing protein [Terriglobus roseus]|uniref:NHL repeat-containing protein n=2 Tax=Terriglobus roseus TaxID=392734 RepID=A0A1G7IBE3_9BACT|nr:NHL repeat-containing protein [Terriglobus roseus]
MKLSPLVAPIIRGHIRSTVPCVIRCSRHILAFALLFIAFSIPSQTRLVLNSGNTITTLSGNGSDGRTAAGNATTTRMGTPRTVVYDATGNLFVADSRNNIVTSITPAGQLTVVAGTGREGYDGDSGAATKALLNRPTSIALKSDGTLFIADTGNHCIRSVSPDGTITTIAGNGKPGDSADGSPAKIAQLRNPSGLALDSDGTLLIADTGNHRIRRIAANGNIVAVAGTGKEGDSGDGGSATNATFRRPASLLVLNNGAILIADTDARRIRMLSPDGTISAYGNTTFRSPQGMTLDASGNIVVADAQLQQVLQTSTTANNNLAGNGKQGTLATGALNSPSSVATNANGDIAISDRRNHQVQRLALPSLDFGSIPIGQTSATQTLLLQNAADTPLLITSVTLSPAFSIASNGNCSTPPFTLAAKAQCSLQLAFTPQANGSAQTIGLVQSSSAPPSMLRLTGIGVPGTNLATSRIALVSDGSISYSGAPIKLTATVAGSLLTPPTGNVIFQDGSNNIATVQLTAGAAILSTASLTAGTHTLRAIYSGDSAYATSTSTSITQTVVAAPDFSLTTSATSYSGGANNSVSIPITLLPLNGTLNHTTTLTISGLPSGATATFTPSTFTLAGDPIAVSLMIKLPATLARNPSIPTGIFSALLLLGIFPPKRKRLPAFLLILGTLSLQGCGGFRTTSITNPADNTHRYNCTITATTTGVVGDTLTHSVPVELDLTQ